MAQPSMRADRGELRTPRCGVERASNAQLTLLLGKKVISVVVCVRTSAFLGMASFEGQGVVAGGAEPHLRPRGPGATAESRRGCTRAQPVTIVPRIIRATVIAPIVPSSFPTPPFRQHLFGVTPRGLVTRELDREIAAGDSMSSIDTDDAISLQSESSAGEVILAP
ncbi:hypothetical protein QBC34DRAFT_431744 [Podospora aff. communis PSN243]|uniref:Uncharacterized protein n=1 Tax=Podospora aff. communis PSN243 TaxID=3040156 RepID=A0AAV9G556_9PEZI|nr:hypothetical protein QBC34DRAFT_431744 [Podospora aff. communis PSN243]